MTLLKCTPAVSLLALALACGGGDGSGGVDSASTASPMPLAAAAETLRVVTVAELNPLSGTTLPMRVGDGNVQSLSLAGVPHPCVTASTQVGNPTKVTWTFACSQTSGSSLTGKMIWSLPASGATTVTYQNLRLGTFSGSITLNGSKTVTFATSSKTASVAIDASLPMQVVVDEGGSARTFTYWGTVTTDWSGQPKLWGTTNVKQGTDAPILVTIAPSTPLTWNLVACCYPITGLAVLTQGNLRAEATFGPVCGSVSVKPNGLPAQVLTLPNCPY